MIKITPLCRRKILFFCALVSASFTGFSKIKPAAIFTDHMILQQQTDAAIWGWAKPMTDVKVTTSWNKKIYTVKSNQSGKFIVKVATPVAGGPYNIEITDGEKLVLNDVLIGEVWFLGGQSNMEMPLKGNKNQPITGSNETILKSYNKNIRLYTVPRVSTTEIQENSKPSDWKIASPETVPAFSAVGYFFGKLINEIKNVPIGLINDNFGGSSIEAWMSADELNNFPEIVVPKKGDSIKVQNQTPTTLFNGMLYPILGYGIRGVLWYQGESNRNRYERYADLFPAMVADWRKKWGIGEFPFYWAQIAPFGYAVNDKEVNSALIRDVQRTSLTKIPNSGMAVLMDVGEEKLIHPANKKEVGDRLAYIALAKNYGIKGIGFESPNYESISIKGNKVTIKFVNKSNGLTSFGKELKQFEIAGEDRQFYPAKAVISGNNVVVEAVEVKNPIAVRYAFKNFVVGDLFGVDGLPVSSFRTDTWDK
jgi:sialate O-acetylesterase